MPYTTATALHTAVGWDDVTGVGTPNAQAFVHSFIPGADTADSAMRTSGPTTGAPHAFSHFIEADFYPAVARLFLPGGCDPAYPLIAREWGDRSPDIRDRRIRLDGSA